MCFYLFLACHTTVEKKIVEVPHHKTTAMAISVVPSDAEILIDGHPWGGANLELGMLQRANSRFLIIYPKRISNRKS